MALFGTLKNPKGPDMTKLESFSISLSGTKIEFATPVSNDLIMPDEYRPGPYNLYDDTIFETMDDCVQPVPGFGCFTRFWKFEGYPLIHSNIGYISLEVTVAKQDEFSNLFRPRRAEKAIERYIYTRQGPAAGIFYSECRMNWRIVENAGCTWMNYKNTERGFEHSHWHLPLTDTHMLVVKIISKRLHNTANLDNCFASLENELISTFKVNYSPSALKAKEEAASESPSERFSETLPPLIWEEKRVEDEWTIRDRVFDQFNPENKYYLLPNGEIDHSKHEKESDEISKEVKRIQKEQREILDKKIHQAIRSHLEFN